MVVPDLPVQFPYLACQSWLIDSAWPLGCNTRNTVTRFGDRLSANCVTPAVALGKPRCRQSRLRWDRELSKFDKVCDKVCDKVHEKDGRFNGLNATFALGLVRLTLAFRDRAHAVVYG